MSDSYLFPEIRKLSFIFDLCLTMRLIHATDIHPQLRNLHTANQFHFQQSSVNINHITEKK